MRGHSQAPRGRDSMSPTPHRSPSVSLHQRISLSALCSPSPSMQSPSMATTSDTAPSVSNPTRSLEHAPRTDSRTPGSLSLDADDESVMIAVRALDDMRSGASSSVPSSSSPSPYQSGSSQSRASSSSESHSSLPTSEDQPSPPQFVSRVSGLPIVNSALRAYEQSKASSRVVKYGAEMMESSVRSISRPVIDRLPVNQLDDFACRQLDRFGRSGNASESEIDRERTPNPEMLRHDSELTIISQDQTNGRTSKAKFKVGGDDDDMQDTPQTSSDGSSPSRSLSKRSLLQTILYEAGGISAAVSSESMKSLKFCLQWLQYATEHTDGQILILRNFIASLNAGAEEGDERPISATHMQTLTNVKRDVVKTVRQVVEVVSKYAGGALPEPARGRVRQFVLLLPQRWASTTHRTVAQARNKNRRAGSNSNPASAASTAPPTPLQSPRLSTRGLPGAAEGSHRQTTTARPTASSAAQAAQRILTLATESLDMMRNVNAIFKESLDRADVWVDRLRVVGIQRHENPDGTVEDISPNELRRIASDALIASDGGALSTSATSTATFTSFPPSPRNWPTSSSAMSSPSSSSSKLALATVNSLDALTLASASAGPSTGFVTPKSASAQNLVNMGGYDWELTTRKLQTLRDTDERSRSIIEEEEEEEERSAATALNELRKMARPSSTAMEVDTRE